MFGTSKRPLKFAGTWYASNATWLANQIDEFITCAQAKIDNQQTALTSRKILALIAPHAGYMYSGQTAATSYLAAAGAGVKRVFLFGPSHYGGFRGAVLPPYKSFATVFGDLSVDTTVVAELRHCLLFDQRADLHLQEHSLELQLAFIRKIFGNIKIVPILFGKSEELFESQFMASKIAEHLTDDDLIVVSSDFTHIGPRYGYTPFHISSRDQLEKLDMEAFSCLQKPSLEAFLSFFERTGDTICGVYAIAALLGLLPSDSAGVLLDYSTSQEQAPEEKENSVSYLSIAFTSERSWSQIRAASEVSIQTGLTDGEKESLLNVARITLESYVREGRVPAMDELFSKNVALTDKLVSPHGAFVTLYKKDVVLQESKLRGCIGNILPTKPLYKAVIDNTVASCSRDYRFDPVHPSELGNLELEISVLTPPKRVDSAKDIKLGEDGILLHVGDCQSVFLPQVATEYGWTLEETLEQLSLKAGLDRSAWKRNARFEVFQAESLHE